MAAGKKSNRVTEFGDFQTPVHLACRVCKLLLRRKLSPASILEPTCGAGNLLQERYLAEVIPRCKKGKMLFQPRVVRGRYLDGSRFDYVKLIAELSLTDDVLAVVRILDGRLLRNPFELFIRRLGENGI